MPLKFSVGEVPHTKPYHFADLAELMILVPLASQVSKADLEGLITTGNQDSDPDPEIFDHCDDAIDQNSRAERSSEDCFRQLIYRQGALDELYPFTVADSLLVPRQQIGVAGYLYLFCLICSRLASFSGQKGFAQRCARLFTELAAVALRASLKESAIVYVFDAGSEDRATHFDTNLREALRKLAKLLNASHDEELVSQQSTSGDGGLDLVAINTLGCKAKGIFAYFGQCAAQQNGWPRKTLEAKRSAAFFMMGHPASNLLYTPVMYRNATGRWVNDLYSTDCVIFDRLRIMKALQPVLDNIPPVLLGQIRAVVDDAASALVA